MSGSIEVNVGLAGFGRIDFDRRKVRRAIRIGARLVQREARRMVNVRAGTGRSYRVWGDMLHRASAAGSPPAKVSGALQRSLDTRMAPSGFAAFVGPNLSKAFYARFLAAGTGAMQPRPFVDTALDRHRSAIRRLLEDALSDALIPRPL
ncbi:HK97-gp10 family putative phage morphogenesis protein [Magnetospirillum molischianum]|uniref:Phage protein, HK97 gp10 family n=1 Tax=Magnetospirillum molischianum DSM 120 TaxID=1150626 RepID=H8FUZ3_MAGML|nr:hypothetical protein [Magnetospirillum molischianum]CCG42181.1 hypothetical protein PHAMO_340054 [Magnetospirillum molischianum DSM 120]